MTSTGANVPPLCAWRRNYRTTFRDVIRQTRIRFLAFGWQGRVVAGAFGVALLVSTLTGLVIYGRFIKALPRWWSIRRRRGLQITLSDWHKLISILALAFDLIIAVTGAVLGLESRSRSSGRTWMRKYASPPTQAVR